VEAEEEDVQEAEDGEETLRQATNMQKELKPTELL
jgi:hypothetical protein